MTSDSIEILIWEVEGFDEIQHSEAESKMLHYPAGSGCLDTGRKDGNQSHPVKCQVSSVWSLCGDGSVFSGVPVSFVANMGCKTKMD